MEGKTSAEHASMRERALEEFKAYWIIALYLVVFLSALTNYRRLILAEFGIEYIHYGIAVVEALIIAKVILIGKVFHFSRLFEGKPLIVPVLYKSILFGALVFAFGIVERVVEAAMRKSIEIFNSLAPPQP